MAFRKPPQFMALRERRRSICKKVDLTLEMRYAASLGFGGFALAGISSDDGHCFFGCLAPKVDRRQFDWIGDGHHFKYLERGATHCLARLVLHELDSILFNGEWYFSLENIIALVLKKPELDRVSASVRKRTPQGGKSNECFVVSPKSRRGLQWAIKNGFVGLVVDYQNVAGKHTSSGTRKNQEKPKSRPDKREGLGNDLLAQSFHVEYAGLYLAFANTIANRHEPNARRQYQSRHNRLPKLA
jgi:hypothetical protein